LYYFVVFFRLMKREQKTEGKGPPSTKFRETEESATQPPERERKRRREEEQKIFFGDQKLLNWAVPGTRVRLATD
jgi:hypothetical protein